jgi:C4-dicarboxylate-specific signal transduction histidine kinase
MATRQVFVASQILTAEEQNALATAMIAIRASTAASTTAVLADDGKLVTMSNASANTFTVPPNSSVAFGIGTQINIAQLGAGQTSYCCWCWRDIK